MLFMGSEIRVITAIETVIWTRELLGDLCACTWLLSTRTFQSMIDDYIFPTQRWIL